MTLEDKLDECVWHYVMRDPNSTTRYDAEASATGLVDCKICNTIRQKGCKNYVPLSKIYKKMKGDGSESEDR
jgi:hypothetical protein